MLLFLKNLLFTVFVPGTVAVLIPYRMVTGDGNRPVFLMSRLLGAAPLFLLGAGIYFWCLWHFAVTGRGTPAPIDPPTQLVVRGLYRRVRNPMYLGVLLVVAGWVVLSRAVAVLEYGVGVAALFHVFVVFVEEPLLRRRFGSSYEAYCRAVRRWVPGRPYRSTLAVVVCLLGPFTGEPACAQGREWMFGPFEKPTEANPAIAPSRSATFRSPLNDSTVHWEAFATFNPAAVVKDGNVYVLYRAEDATGGTQIGRHTSRIGLAESADGLHFTRAGTPVLYPDKDAQATFEWPGGVEDPRIVETDDGTYVLTYTQWNRDVPRLAIATSRDLVHWQKHGPAFAQSEGGKYRNLESKSGAIVSRVAGNRLLATRVNGKYWMYFDVPDILAATSDNLADWTPLADADGKLLKVLSPRPGYFDSWLVEPGPPAVITERGILLLYNAGNSGEYGDPSLPRRIYTGGQALFDLRNPLRLIARSDEPFIKPTEAYERTGQYTEGTTFVEGLVPFGGRWYLYYGTADSRVGVAVWDPNRKD